MTRGVEPPLHRYNATMPSERDKPRRPQYRLLHLFVMTLSIGVLLALWRVFGGGIGRDELIIFAVMTVFVLFGAVLGWPWSIGVIVCLIVAVMFTPADPISMLMVSFPLSITYTVGVIVWKSFRSRRDS